jgi:hypothetical protein
MPLRARQRCHAVLTGLAALALFLAAPPAIVMYRPKTHRT